MHDLAYVAYRLCPFAEDASPPAGVDAHGRLVALVTAYCAPPGVDLPPADVLAAIPARLLELAEFSEALAASNGQADLRGHAAMYRRDADRLAPG